jgi:hypothetical protein
LTVTGNPKKFNHLPALLSGVLAVSIFVMTASAQPPLAVVGDAFGVDVTSGSGSFPNAGHYLLLPADSGAGYQIIGAGGSVNSSGTYSFSRSNAFGLLNLSDNHLGSVKGSADFAGDWKFRICRGNGANHTGRPHLLCADK